MSRAPQSDEVARKDPARKPSNAGAVFKPAVCLVAEPVEAGGVVDMVRVPKGVTVFAASVTVERQGRDTLRLNVGDGDSPKRFLSGGVVPKFGGRLDATGAGSICDYEEEATVTVTVVEGVLEPGDVVRAVVGYAAS